MVIIKICVYAAARVCSFLYFPASFVLVHSRLAPIIWIHIGEILFFFKMNPSKRGNV